MLSVEDKAYRESLYELLLEPVDKHLERMKADALRAGEGIDTGFSLHNRSAAGDISDFNLRIPKFAITMVCARTGGGKTTILSNLALRMSEAGANGLFITLEEPGYAIRAKLLSGYSRSINLNHSLMASTVWQATKAIAGHGKCAEMDKFNRKVMRHVRIVDANTLVDETKIISPTVMYDPQFVADLIAYRNSKSRKALDFVIIDFGQLMESDGIDNSSSYQRMKAVMQGMKNLAGGLGIAVVMGVQLQRSCASVSIWDWEPEMIRDGSDMEQAASLILAIGQDKKFHDPECNMVLRFLKNRNGPKRVAGMFKIEWEYCYIPLTGLKPTDD